MSVCAQPHLCQLMTLMLSFLFFSPQISPAEQRVWLAERRGWREGGREGGRGRQRLTCEVDFMVVGVLGDRGP